jgi:hypothetical protein
MRPLLAAAALLLLSPAAPTAASSSSDQRFCSTKAYQKATLLHLASVKLGAVFPDAGGMRQFEGSAISVGPTGAAAVIFDNAHTVGLIEPGTLLPFAPKGALVGRRRANQSQHEGVAWKADGGGDAGGGAPPSLLALVEAAPAPDGVLRARIDEYRLPPPAAAPRPSLWTRALRLGRGGAHRAGPAVAGDPALVEACWIDFELTHDNKGLEDLVYLGAGRALALCEGNRCVGGASGRDPGHGRILALAYRAATAAAPCAWTVDRVLALPPDAAFIDYAGLALRSGWMAVLSQESGAVWVGRFDAESLTFPPRPASAPSRVFGLPRDHGCRPWLCHAEGIDFLEDPGARGPARVVVTTDKARFGSPWPCVASAESLHLFSLPRKALPQPEPDGGEGGREEL